MAGNLSRGFVLLRRLYSVPSDAFDVDPGYAPEDGEGEQ